MKYELRPNLEEQEQFRQGYDVDDEVLIGKAYFAENPKGRADWENGGYEVKLWVLNDSVKVDELEYKLNSLMDYQGSLNKKPFGAEFMYIKLRMQAEFFKDVYNYLTAGDFIFEYYKVK